MIWTPCLMLFYKEIRRFMKVIVQTVLTPFVTSFLYLLIFGVSLGNTIKLDSGLSYLAFLIPGLIMMSVLNNCYQNTSSSIISGKFSGDLEDLRVAPITDFQIMLAMGLAALVRGLMVGVITLFVGILFYYSTEGVFLGLHSPIWLMFFLVVGGMSYAFLGIVIAFWAKTFDQSSAFSSFVLLPLTYLGGVFFSIESLHPIWQGLARLNPMLYLINGVRYGMVGVSDVSVESAALISLVGIVIFYGLAAFSLKKGAFARW